MTETSTGGAADVGSFSHAPPLFRGVDRGAVGRLAADAEPVVLRGGEYLFRGGDPADRLYLVRTGRLRVLVDGEDGPKVVQSAGARRRPRRASAPDRIAALGLGTGRSRRRAARTERSTFRCPDRRRSRIRARAPARAGRAAAALRRSDDSLDAADRLRGRSAGGRSRSRAAGSGDRAARLSRFGSVDTLRGDEGSDGYAALLARAEAANDAVLLVAEGTDVDWDAFCRRQADRTVLLAGADTPVGGTAAGCDLVLLGPMPAGRTAR